MEGGSYLLSIVISLIMASFYVFREDVNISKPLTMMYVFPIFIALNIIEKNMHGVAIMGVLFLVITSIISVFIIDKPVIYSVYKNLQYTFLYELSYNMASLIGKYIHIYFNSFQVNYNFIFIVILLIVLLITKLFEKKDSYTTIPQKLDLAIGITVMLMGIVYLYYYMDTKFVGFVVSDVSTVLIFILFLCVMVYIQQLAKAEKYVGVINVLENQLKLQIDHYKSYEKYIEITRRFRHDIKNHNFLVLTLIKKGDYRGAIRYINNLTDDIFDIPYNSITNNKIIDAVLTGAIAKAGELNIKFLYKLNNTENIKVNDIDLSSVFSNLLNNAIEACERMPMNKREINLIVNVKSNVLAIEISNTYNGIVRKDGSSFKTLKSDDRDHGIGMNNLKEIVKKYDGIFNVDYDEKIFKVSITLFFKD